MVFPPTTFRDIAPAAPTTDNCSNSIDFADLCFTVERTGSGLLPGTGITLQSCGRPFRTNWAYHSVGIMKNPILPLPLSAVMRSEIALPLQDVLKIYTVGCLLKAWRSPRNHRGIEQLFDSPEQARHAVTTCAAWLGIATQATHEPVPAWWLGDRADSAAAIAAF